MKDDELVAKWFPKAHIAESDIMKSGVARPASLGRGFMWMCSRSGDEGNAVVVFLEAGVLFMLRQIDDGKYKLAVEYYIRGIMNGEAIIKEYIESEDEFVLI